MLAAAVVGGVAGEAVADTAFAVGVVAAEVEAEEVPEETDSWLLLVVGELSGGFWRGEFFRGKRGICRVGRMEGEGGSVFPTLGRIEEGTVSIDAVEVGMATEEAKLNGGGSKLGVTGADGDFCDAVRGKWRKWPKCTCMAAFNLGEGGLVQ